MIYFDNAATGGEKPAAVQNAVLAAMQACANPGRGGHTRAIACAKRVLACRALLSELFDGYGVERTVFTKNCTEALNIAILGTLKRGDHAVVTCMEHNSVLRPLAYLQRTCGVTYSVAPLVDGKLLPETIASLIRPETKLCCVTSASNVTGLAPDLDAIRARIPQRVLFMVDGAQGAGHLPLQMRRSGIDFLALAGHKGLQAIQGAGALLFSERATPNPVLFGGTGSESFSLEMPAFYPDRLESGTLSYPAICSLFEGALLVKVRRAEWARNLIALTDALLQGLAAMGGYRAYSTPNACGICAFAHLRLPSEEVANLLSERHHMAVRGGLHCAPFAHAALGTAPQGLVRVSFSPFQRLQDVKDLLAALKQLKGVTSA